MTAMPTEQGPQTCGRFEWERIVRRLKLPMRLKFTAMMVATYADADGTRVRPGPKKLAAVTEQGESTVRKHLVALQEYGLLVLVSRGGGRGGVGHTSQYRLSVPADLLSRVPMLPEDERPLSVVPDTPLAQESGVSGEDTETPLPMASGTGESSPVDNPPTTVDKPKTPLARRSGVKKRKSRKLRSGNTVTDQNSARFGQNSARSSEQLPQHNQPPKAPTTTPDPAQPPTARGRASPEDDPCPLCRHAHAFLDPCRAPARSPT